jgi:hypothetical protein
MRLAGASPGTATPRRDRYGRHPSRRGGHSPLSHCNWNLPVNISVKPSPEGKTQEVAVAAQHGVVARPSDDAERTRLLAGRRRRRAELRMEEDRERAAAVDELVGRTCRTDTAARSMMERANELEDNDPETAFRLRERATELLAERELGGKAWRRGSAAWGANARSSILGRFGR